MAKLKPIGSEKLTGMEKINRMLEIARYKENIPESINEDKSIEYSKILPDGNNYQIVKEKNGYVIKKSINEDISSLDYLEPIKNRKYYSSYSQAFKRLNLIVKEVNSSLGQENNISLFEAADEATKYILKLETDEQQNPELPVPAQQPSPESAPSQEPAASTEPMAPTEPSAEEAPKEEPSPEEMPSDETSDESEDQGEVVTLKTIQKLTGKLAQKLREFSSNEENQMSSKDIKYVINSILSALDLKSLDDEDKEQIIGKFEGTEEDSDEDMGTEESGDETPIEPEMDQEMSVETPEPPQGGEMAEDFGDVIADYMTNKAMDTLSKKHPKTAKFVKGLSGDKDVDTDHERAKEMFENLFNESKVESVLQKYFVINENEKKSDDVSKKIRKYSTNIIQEVRAKKVLEKYPSAKFLGKTKKSTLVFGINESKLGVTKSGKII